MRKTFCTRNTYCALAIRNGCARRPRLCVACVTMRPSIFTDSSWKTWVVRCSHAIASHYLVFHVASVRSDGRCVVLKSAWKSLTVIRNLCAICVSRASEIGKQRGKFVQGRMKRNGDKGKEIYSTEAIWINIRALCRSRNEREERCWKCICRVIIGWRFP